MLSFNYGQRHKKELEYAAITAKKLKAEHRIVDISNITDLISRSVLTDLTTEVPEGHYAAENMAQTVVPNRNSIMLSIAIGWAVNLEADTVAIAVHSGDHYVYPDCRPQFIKAQELTAIIGNEGFLPSNFKLAAPWSHLTKAHLVAIGRGLGVPFEDTWSCYKGGDRHCSKCGTCAERREAFILAGVKDPTEYEISEKEFKEWWDAQK